ncbi:MAG: fibronectin type III domain-containing protein, partial [Acidobacteria bacterium]|nr:fibronectin type III domain-containing protein [Acidobacteriota bacterium]
DTRLDPSIEIVTPDVPALRRKSSLPFFAYGFRSKAGKPIVAYWLGAHSVPGNVFPPIYADLVIRNSGIRRPALIDVVSGEIHPLEWKAGAADVLPHMPIRDTVLAVADEDYIDWPVLPEAPSSLAAVISGGSVRLRWEVHGGDALNAIIERRTGQTGPWSRIATQPAGKQEYMDTGAATGQTLCYRVRMANNNGESAYSNIVRVRR